MLLKFVNNKQIISVFIVQICFNNLAKIKLDFYNYKHIFMNQYSPKIIASKGHKNPKGS